MLRIMASLLLCLMAAIGSASSKQGLEKFVAQRISILKGSSVFNKLSYLKDGHREHWFWVGSLTVNSVLKLLQEVIIL